MYESYGTKEPIAWLTKGEIRYTLEETSMHFPRPYDMEEITQSFEIVQWARQQPTCIHSSLNRQDITELWNVLKRVIEL